MGSCGRFGESPNSWKHFGPDPTQDQHSVGRETQLVLYYLLSWSVYCSAQLVGRLGSDGVSESGTGIKGGGFRGYAALQSFGAPVRNSGSVTLKSQMNLTRRSTEILVQIYRVQNAKYAVDRGHLPPSLISMPCIFIYLSCLVYCRPFYCHSLFLLQTCHSYY